MIIFAFKNTKEKTQDANFSLESESAIKKTDSQKKSPLSPPSLGCVAKICIMT